MSELSNTVFVMICYRGNFDRPVSEAWERDRPGQGNPRPEESWIMQDHSLLELQSIILNNAEDNASFPGEGLLRRVVEI